MLDEATIYKICLCYITICKTEKVRLCGVLKKIWFGLTQLLPPSLTGQRMAVEGVVCLIILTKEGTGRFPYQEDLYTGSGQFKQSPVKQD